MTDVEASALVIFLHSSMFLLQFAMPFEASTQGEAKLLRLEEKFYALGIMFIFSLAKS